MANITITVNNADIPDVLAGLERRWKADVVRRIGEAAYEALGPAQRVRACLQAVAVVAGRNERREAAERAISVAEPDVT